ncbi:MAG: transposase [Chthoniobacterales bacterium]|nr:transposase [Chthoniobacterales bacterium]
MARSLRIEYEGALYHVLSRGDRREAIFLDEADWREFLHTLAQVCGKTGWQVQAYCLMSNHFHLVLETPQANLTVGMQWFLGTYTQRFNRRHGLSGHLFQGRYKAQLIDERSRSYLRAACDYVHLNPARAGLIAPKEKLEAYRWSSYVAYRHLKERPPWLRIDRLFGAHGLGKDTAATRREFERRMAAARVRPAGEAEGQLRRGWKVGAEDFADWLAEKLSRPGRRGELARERAETDEALAQRLIAESLAVARWGEVDLASAPKGHPLKVEIARQLRSQTPMSRRWIAERLRMGSTSYLSNLLSSVDSKL